MVGHLRRGDLIGSSPPSAERETLDRVQAVMAVIEGHAEHVMDAVAPDLLPSLPKLRAALDRRRKSQSGFSRLVARLLGLELKLKQYERGKIFCDAVVRPRRAGGPAARVLLARGAADAGRDRGSRGVARTGGTDRARSARRRSRARAPRSPTCNTVSRPGYKHVFGDFDRAI